jgi:hypothetical protein
MAPHNAGGARLIEAANIMARYSPFRKVLVDHHAGFDVIVAGRQSRDPASLEGAGIEHVEADRRS